MNKRTIPKNNKLLPFAKELRKDMTPQERKFWYLFLRQYPIKIYKQRIIDDYIVDFYCHAARLVIEVDGAQHYTEDGVKDDRNRSGVLESYGLFVLRFSNSAVDTQFQSVCDRIDQVIKERMREATHDEL